MSDKQAYIYANSLKILFFILEEGGPEVLQLKSRTILLRKS